MIALIIICIIMTAATINEFFVKKRHFSALIYIWAGIIVPLAFYLLGWSALIEKDINWMFVYIFAVFTIISLSYSYTTRNLQPARLKAKDTILLTKTGRWMVPVVTISFILLYLLENYIATGTFAPALRRIDEHTISVPIISYFTHSMFAVISINYYAYKATKKKRYILAIVIILALPVATRLARMTTMIAAVQIFSLYLFFDGVSVGNRIKTTLKSKIRRRVIIALGIAAVAGLVALTNYRMSHFGKYDITYQRSIAYTGPDWLSFLAPYYGYFPLSFNNLNLT